MRACGRKQSRKIARRANKGSDNFCELHNETRNHRGESKGKALKCRQDRIDLNRPFPPRRLQKNTESQNELTAQLVPFARLVFFVGLLGK